MKKWWYGLGGLIGIGAVAGTAATVVSCGNTKNAKDSISKPEDEFSNDKNSKIFNLVDTLKAKNNLWLKFDEFLNLNSGKKDEKNSSQHLWFNKFDYRHGLDWIETAKSMLHFEKHQIADRIKLIGDSEGVISRDEIKFQAISMVNEFSKQTESLPRSTELNVLWDTIDNFNLNKDNDNQNILNLLRNVAISAEMFNESQNEIYLDTNLKVTSGYETLFNRKLGVEVVSNTLVYFSDDNDKGFQEHLVLKGKAIFSNLTINIDLTH